MDGAKSLWVRLALIGLACYVSTTSTIVVVQVALQQDTESPHTSGNHKLCQVSNKFACIIHKNLKVSSSRFF